MPLESIFVILAFRVEEDLVVYVVIVVIFVVFEVEFAF